MEALPVICPHCHNATDETNYFCPNCGHKLKDPPPSTSIGRQISLYILSLFVPPFGLFPAFKYIRQHDSKAQKIGVVMISLTIFSLVLSIWITANFINTANQEIQQQLGPNVDPTLIPNQNLFQELNYY